MTPPRHSKRGSLRPNIKMKHFIAVALIGFLLVVLTKLPIPAVLDFSSPGGFPQQGAPLRASRFYQSDLWRKFEARVGEELEGAPGHYSVTAFNPETFQTFSCGPDEAYPAASVIKIVVLAAALEAWQNGRLDFLEEHLLSPSDWVEGSGVLRFAHPGRVCTMGELLRLMIIESDNIATNIVIDRLGIAKIQEFMNRAGFADCKIEHAILDRAAVAQGLKNEITAREMAAFLAAMDRGWILGPQATAIFWSVMEQQRRDDRFPALLPAGIPVASKTGTLNGVVHDAGRLGKGPDRVILVCLSRDVPDRWGASRRIARIARNWYDVFIAKGNRVEEPSCE